MLYKPSNSCEICGQGERPLSVCKMCKSCVCELCYIVSDGICLNCQEARCQVCGEYLAARACNVCGKLVCEDHGIKINESTLCDDCRMRD